MPVIDAVYDLYVPKVRLALYEAFSSGHEVFDDVDLGGFSGLVRDAVSKASGPFNDLYEINDLAEEYARRRSASRVTQINDDVRKTIRTTLANGIKEGLTDDQIAKRLKTKIGLTDRMSNAVDNYRDGLLKGGMKSGQANLAASRYAEDLKLARANAIAQTEVAAAFNTAQHLVWLQAVETGDLRSDVKLVWKTHPTEFTCPTCKSLNGKTVKLMDESTKYKVGKNLVSAPPLHPHCRCTEEVVDVLGKSIPEFNQGEGSGSRIQ